MDNRITKLRNCGWACIETVSYTHLDVYKRQREIYDLIMAQPVPSASIDDAGKWMLLLERNTFPSVAELAEPELRIAGLRINPNNFAQSRMVTIAGMKLKDINTLQEHAIAGLPANMLSLIHI